MCVRVQSLVCMVVDGEVGGQHSMERRDEEVAMRALKNSRLPVWS